MPTSSKLPATTGPKPGAVAKTEQVKLITILKDDFKYDIIKEIVDHIRMIKRAKKIKPTEKHRMLMNYNLTLLQFCMPKMKLVEDAKDDGKPISFQINVPIVNNPAPVPMPTGNPKAKKGKGGISITIPTVKNSDGTFAVTTDKE